MPSDLVVVGLSYRTAPLDVREKLTFASEALEPTLRAFQALPSIGEACLISTCNRTEVYAATRAGTTAAGAAAAIGEIRRLIAQARGFSDEDLAPHLYESSGEAAVRHVFRVASSLDSLVVGESQILGQVKTAYGAASTAGCVGPLLGRCLEQAFRVAKRVRSETAIARGGANVSSVAVELTKKIFGELDGKRILIVGAGKMSDLAARHLHADGAADILVTNRSPERAVELARKVGGEARPYAELERLLGAVDIVISSTGAPEPIIDTPLVKRVMKARRHEPLFFIDIAVPRDVDPAVGQLDGVYLFDLDDLERVVAENLADRKKEAGDAERIIDGEARKFSDWLRGQGVVPTIKDLRERFHEVAAAEADRTLGSLRGRLDEKDERAIRAMADAIVGKLLHDPFMALKSGDGEDTEALVTATRRLFALSEQQMKARKPDDKAGDGPEKPDESKPRLRIAGGGDAGGDS